MFACSITCESALIILTLPSAGQEELGFGHSNLEILIEHRGLAGADRRYMLHSEIVGADACQYCVWV